MKNFLCSLFILSLIFINSCTKTNDAIVDNYADYSKDFQFLNKNLKQDSNVFNMNNLEVRAILAEYIGSVQTKTSTNNYTGLNCNVKLDGSLFIYVKRRYSSVNGKLKLLPEPKNGDVGIIDSKTWQYMGLSNGTMSWKLNTINIDAASLYLPKTYIGASLFRFKVGATMTYRVVNGSGVVTITGIAFESYSTNSTISIVFK